MLFNEVQNSSTSLIQRVTFQVNKLSVRARKFDANAYLDNQYIIQDVYINVNLMRFNSSYSLFSCQALTFDNIGLVTSSTNTRRRRSCLSTTRDYQTSSPSDQSVIAITHKKPTLFDYLTVFNSVCVCFTHFLLEQSMSQTVCGTHVCDCSHCALEISRLI